jgi:hypothetical protein
MTFYRDLDNSLEGVAKSDLLKDVVAPRRLPVTDLPLQAPDPTLPLSSPVVSNDSLSNQVNVPEIQVSSHIKDGETIQPPTNGSDDLSDALRESLALAPN